jgi:hypothetical protein
VARALIDCEAVAIAHGDGYGDGYGYGYGDGYGN